MFRPCGCQKPPPQPWQTMLDKRQLRRNSQTCFHLLLGKTRAEKCFCSKHTEWKDKSPLRWGNTHLNQDHGILCWMELSEYPRLSRRNCAFLVYRIPGGIILLYLHHNLSWLLLLFSAVVKYFSKQISICRIKFYLSPHLCWTLGKDRIMEFPPNLPFVHQSQRVDFRTWIVLWSVKLPNWN